MNQATTQFAVALFQGDVARAAAFLERGGVDVNARQGAATLLHRECAAGRVEAVRLLLANGADPNAPNEAPSTGETPLMAAVACPRVSDAIAIGLSKLLLENGAELGARDACGRTAVFHALPYADRVRALLDAGADVDALDLDGCSALAVAMSTLAMQKQIAQLGMIHAFLRAVSGPSAAGVGDVSRTIALLRERNAVDAGAQWLALIYAAREGDEDEVEALLARGVDPNHGALQRPLQAAAASGHEAIVRRLLEAGADARVCTTDGRSVYDAARRSLVVLEVLLDRGVRAPISENALHEIDHERRTARSDRPRWDAVFGRLSAGRAALLMLAPLSSESRALLEAALLEPDLFSELHHEAVHVLESTSLDPTQAIELYRSARERLAPGWTPVLVIWSLRDNAGTVDELEDAVRAIESRSASDWFRERERQNRALLAEYAPMLAGADVPSPRDREPSFGQGLMPHPLHLVLVRGPVELLPVCYRWGWGNECPTPLEQAVVLRSWRERFGAQLVYLGRWSELTVARPPTDPTQARELARECALFCPEPELMDGCLEMAVSTCWSFGWD